VNTPYICRGPTPFSARRRDYGNGNEWASVVNRDVNGGARAEGDCPGGQYAGKEIARDTPASCTKIPFDEAVRREAYNKARHGLRIVVASVYKRLVGSRFSACSA
jgi:hypothetical protein